VSITPPTAYHALTQLLKHSQFCEGCLIITRGSIFENNDLI
jgi:hypothetical protein